MDQYGIALPYRSISLSTNTTRLRIKVSTIGSVDMVATTVAYPVSGINDFWVAPFFGDDIPNKKHIYKCVLLGTVELNFRHCPNKLQLSNMVVDIVEVVLPC